MRSKKKRNWKEEKKIGAIKTFLWIVQTCKKFVHYSIFHGALREW